MNRRFLKCLGSRHEVACAFRSTDDGSVRAVELPAASRERSKMASWLSEHTTHARAYEVSCWSETRGVTNSAGLTAYLLPGNEALLSSHLSE
jgi:acylphosphatase